MLPTLVQFRRDTCLGRSPSVSKNYIDFWISELTETNKIRKTFWVCLNCESLVLLKIRLTVFLSQVYSWPHVSLYKAQLLDNSISKCLSGLLWGLTKPAVVQDLGKAIAIFKVLNYLNLIFHIKCVRLKQGKYPPNSVPLWNLHLKL